MSASRAMPCDDRDAMIHQTLVVPADDIAATISDAGCMNVAERAHELRRTGRCRFLVDRGYGFRIIDARIA